MNTNKTNDFYKKMMKALIWNKIKQENNYVKYVDLDNHFVEYFCKNTGNYLRTGILSGDLSEEGTETNEDPFMRNFPNLLDIGIMGHCSCAKICPVGCYQNALKYENRPNMSANDFEDIMKQCEGKVFSVALGGAGNPDDHEEFEEILKISNKYGIVPNYTTSGLTFTKEKAELTKKYCGACAVSAHLEKKTIIMRRKKQ